MHRNGLRARVSDSVYGWVEFQSFKAAGLTCLLLARSGLRAPNYECPLLTQSGRLSARSVACQ